MFVSTQAVLLGHGATFGDLQEFRRRVRVIRRALGLGMLYGERCHVSIYGMRFFHGPELRER
jgi:hypothetical protein